MILFSVALVHTIWGTFVLDRCAAGSIAKNNFFLMFNSRRIVNTDILNVSNCLSISQR